MVKLTPDMIEQAVQYINPVRDRELLLRGYKIPVIENMGATLDQFDTIDFSDNDIRKLDGFPMLPRIKALFFNNNRICRISEDVHTYIPNLHELYLTNCEIGELSDLDSLSAFKKLEFLSLLRNPVTHRQHYRLYVIHRVPQVRVLDFRRVRLKFESLSRTFEKHCFRRERQESKKLFGSKQGKQLMTDIGKKRKTFVPGAPITSNGVEDVGGPSKADREAIKEAILKATSLEEVERLKQSLQAGQIPNKSQPNGQSSTQSEVEMDDD